jgi:hypothetical protein
MAYFGENERKIKYVVSQAAVFFMVVVVLACVFSIFIMRAAIVVAEKSGKLAPGSAKIIAAVVNVVQISVRSAHAPHACAHMCVCARAQVCW